MLKENFNSNFLIIVFSDNLYKFHYSLSMASSLKAINKEVTLFFSGYACNYIRKDWQFYDKESIGKKLKEKKMGSITDMFIYCKELQIKAFFCKTALDFLNIKIDDITNLIEIKPISMYSILNSNKKSQILFI